jgi:hypothetical protein
MRSGRRLRSRNRNAHQPGIKLGLPLKLSQVLIRLQERVLHNVFGILAILRDVLRNAENVAVVPLHQLLKRCNVSAASGIDQQRLFAGCFGYVLFDGFHG